MDIINRAKERVGNWHKLAAELGISDQQMSDIKNGRKPASVYQVAKCAELLGERWYDSAFEALAENARTAKERAFWLGKAGTLAMTAAQVVTGVLLVMTLALGVFGTGARSPSESFSDLRMMRNVYYVK